MLPIVICCELTNGAQVCTLVAESPPHLSVIFKPEVGMIARNPSEIDIDDTPHQLRSHAGAVIYDKHRLLVHLLEFIQRQYISGTQATAICLPNSIVLKL